MPPLCTSQGCCNLPYLGGGLPASRVNSPHHHRRRATHPATHATLSVKILRILESRMEKRTSLRVKKRETGRRRRMGRRREKERERKKVGEAWRAVISNELSLPCLGRRAHGLYGEAFDFLKGIGSDGYASE